MHVTRVRSARRKLAARLVASAAAWTLLLVLLPRCAKFGAASESPPDAAEATSDDAGVTRATEAGAPVALPPRVRSTSISDTGTIARPPAAELGDRLIFAAVTRATALDGGSFGPLASTPICPDTNQDAIAVGSRIDDGTTSYTVATKVGTAIHLLLAAVANAGAIEDSALSSEFAERADDGWATPVQVGHDGDLVLLGFGNLAPMMFDQDAGLRVERALADGVAGLQLFSWSTPLDGGAPYVSPKFGPVSSQRPCWGTFSIAIAPRTTTP